VRAGIAEQRAPPFCRLALSACDTFAAAVSPSVVERCEPIKSFHQAFKYDHAATLRATV